MEERYSYAEAFEMFAFDPDVSKCLCKGSGWALSDRDSWHRCPEHWTKESRHPEDEGPDFPQCTECWDGADYPCDKCPICGVHVQKQREAFDSPEDIVIDDLPESGPLPGEIPF